MNKQKLRTYLNGAKDKKDLKTKCIKGINYYLISDTYSIIKLNSNYDLEVMEDKFGLDRLFDRFENNYEVDYTFMSVPVEEEQLYLDKDYMINKKLFNKINNVIKSNVFTVLHNMNTSDKTPIIKLENTKTGEYGYMLPMRRF